MKKPSMTKLLSLLDKPALLRWANKKGLEGIEISAYKKTKQDIGTSIHNRIVYSLETGEAFGDEIETELFLKFFENKNVISYENSIENDYFTGRYDMILSINNVKYLIDFKTKFKRFYLEHKLQLIGYNDILNCEKIAIVSVPDFTIFELAVLDKTPYLEIIKSLNNIYTNKILIKNDL